MLLIFSASISPDFLVSPKYSYHSLSLPTYIGYTSYFFLFNYLIILNAFNTASSSKTIPNFILTLFYFFNNFFKI